MDERPLFIPLRREWFDQFEDGRKDTEYRVHGPGWNERTCRVGRRVTLSCGYGKHRTRLTGTITQFEVLPAAQAHPAFREIYPTAPEAAAIRIRVDRE